MRTIELGKNQGNTGDFLSDEELEKLRKKARTRYIIAVILAVAALIGSIPIIWSCKPEEYGMIIDIIITIIAAGTIGLGALGLFYWMIVQRAYNKFNQAFKSKYVLSVVSANPDLKDLAYSQKRGFTYDEIRNAAVVACGQQQYFLSEDLLTGTYKDIEFRFSDVTSRRMVRRGKKNVIEEIFEGQVMSFSEFDERKISDGHLQIFQKEFLSNIKGWTADHKIETDNALFNKKFQVYAADEHNAYYVLTPQVIEKIMEFSEAVGEQIAVTFRGKYMFVAIARIESLFDGKVDVPVPEQKAHILQDISMLEKAGDILITSRKRE
ncbi:MAG: DUF3137 domain-containing protein [Firmicutes bacterium]|nr:DUF3137 domain-containing protein [Bacillota bacterium]